MARKAVKKAPAKRAAKTASGGSDPSRKRVHDAAAAAAAAAAPPLQGRAETVLKPFLKAHPASIITTRQPIGAAPERIQVNKPWGDPSIALIFPEGELPAMSAALNSVYLPERFTAIIHKDTKKMEVIWTSFSLTGAQADVASREFDFKFKGGTHKCQFGPASQRLLTIARNSFQQGMTDTNYRNLYSFYLRSRVGAGLRASLVEKVEDPRCFWVSNVEEWDDPSLIELSQNINFHLNYYDNLSPVIVVHTPREKSIQKQRYIHGRFPKNVDAKPLDQNLLAFWGATLAADPLLAFVLHFRIIEYAAVHYLDLQLRNDLQRRLSAPHASDNVHATMEWIVSSIGSKALEDVQRFKSVIRQAVDPKLIWNEVAANKTVFAKDTEFDGGFVARKITSTDETEDGFRSKWLEPIAGELRRIRNTLSHGKDMESQGMLLPTPKNYELLRPWKHLIATISAEVMLYRNIDKM